jgi:PhnB protein
MGPDGTVVHATLAIGKDMVMVHDESPHLASRAPGLDGSSPVVIYIYMENVDAVMERAVAAGAKVLIAAADRFWGARVGRIIDPAGHVWNVTTKSGGVFCATRSIPETFARLRSLRGRCRRGQ